MSDVTSAAIREVRNDWMTEHPEMYLRSGGTQGHIMDLAPVKLGFAPLDGEADPQRWELDPADFTPIVVHMAIAR